MRILRLWKTFWHMTASLEKVETDVAFVLPKDYGWGMRNPDDRIWFRWWAPDDFSAQIWRNLNKLLDMYGLGLDIIYDNLAFSFGEKYLEVYLGTVKSRALGSESKINHNWKVMVSTEPRDII
jgi:hypothetical protein